jgi:hypothetical protein
VWDLERMPICKYWRAGCNEKRGCVFRHPGNAEEREECLNFRLGFCSFGPLCEFKHVRRAPEDLPPISELFVPENPFLLKDKRESERPGAQWRTQICKVFMDHGWCPWFEQCRFAHSEAEVRRYVMAAQAAFQAQAQANAASAAAGGNRPGMALPPGSAPGMPMQQQQQQQMMMARPGMVPPRPAMAGAPGFPPGGGTLGGGGGPVPIPAGDPNFPDAALLGRIAELESASLRSAGMPEMSAGSSRFFLVKSADLNNLLVSLRRGEWLTTAGVGERVGAALREAAQAAAAAAVAGGALGGGTPQVLLFFTILNSRYFQGVARVRAPPRPWEGQAAAGYAAVPTGGASSSSSSLPSELSVIPVEWLRTCSLSFSRTKNLRNPLSTPAHLPACMHGDWAEFPHGVGRGLAVLSFKAEPERVNTEDVAMTFQVVDPESEEARAMLAAEDFGPDISAKPPPPPQGSDGAQGQGGGPGGAAGGPQVPVFPDFVREAAVADAVTPPGDGLPRLLPASPLIVGTPKAGPGPANPFIRALLEGSLPPGSPPPSSIAADALLSPDKRLFIVLMNNMSGPLTILRGLVAASDEVDAKGPENMSARDLASIVPGTPIVAMNLHARCAAGVFLARGPAVKDLIPNLIPKMGFKTFDVHIPVVCVADAKPMPESVFGPILRGFPSHIGPVGRAESHAILSRMIGTLPLPQQFLTAALLHQMVVTGAYPFLTDKAGVPTPLGPGGRPLGVDDARDILEAAGPDSLPIPKVAPPQQQQQGQGGQGGGTGGQGAQQQQQQQQQQRKRERD